MSLWRLGETELSEDSLNVKNKLASQDARLAAQQTELLKQSDELNNIRTSLSDALAKLSAETQRNLTLEANFVRCNQDLAQERNVVANLKSSLTSATSKIQERDNEARELQANLESVSDSSNGAQTRFRVLERERDVARSRIKELETDVRHMSSAQAIHQASPTKGKRGRSSSMSNFRINSLESETDRLRQDLSERDGAVDDLTQRLSLAQSGRTHAENEKFAMERRLTREIDELKAIVEDKDDELAFLREQDGGGEREEGLMRRIDEDAAKIDSLELLLRSDDPRKLRSELASLQAKLHAVSLLIAETEAMNIELVGDKEDILDNLETANARVYQLQSRLDEGASMAAPDANTTETIEKLLRAVERLRDERDSLRRQVEFLEPESRFASEALEAHSSRATSHDHTRRIQLATLASAVVIDHLNSQLLSAEEGLLSAANNRASLQSSHSQALNDSHFKLEAMESQSDDTFKSLQNTSRQRDGLVTQLETSEQARHEAQASAERLESQISELEKALDDADTARNSLSLRIVHLEREVSTAQSELTEAEGRYSTLQFHQLSEMSSSEATRALKQQIQELEMRVVRRTEQIGLHQHDIGRLETNLRVAEERVTEMITELDMMSAQKEAMVEDCADARDARDAALDRVERLEEEMESRSDQEETALVTMVEIIAASVSQRRSTQCRQAQLLDHLVSVTAANGQAEATTLAAKSDILALRDQVSCLEQESKQAIVALALAHCDIASRTGAGETQYVLEVKIGNLEDQLHVELARTTSLSQQLDTLREATDSLAKSHERDASLVDEVSSLKEELSQTICALKETQASSSAFERLTEDTQNQLRQEWSDEVATLKQELASSGEDLLCIRRSLQDMTSSRQEIERQLHSMETESSSRVEELQVASSSLQAEFLVVAQQLSQAREEHAQVIQRLEDEVQARAHESHAHQIKFGSAKARADDAEDEVRRLEKQLRDAERRIQEHVDRMKVLENNDLTQQQEVTDLSAEMQKAKSMCRYLEAKLKESESQATNLTTELAAKQSAFEVLSEHKNKLEGNSSLQSAHSRSEIEKLQRQLEGLQTRPNFDKALQDLEERNNEMEELLRQKCVEIEENDDRVLERLKENKKLTSKVETLTRKVQNLQTKLAAAKASSPTLPAPDVSQPVLQQPTPSSSRLRSTTLAGSSVAPIVPPAPPIPSQSSPARYGSSARCLSGPSALPRPKTPERRSHAEFRTRTPENLGFTTSVSREFVPPVPAIGKKRPAPDEFEPIPMAQAFTADSRPSDHVDDDTPRGRRVLTSIQPSGFTPIRNHIRPVIPLPSPKRDASRSRMMENSLGAFSLPPAHTSEQPTKRSWLGKIRGATQVTPSHKARPAFTMTN